jgi:flagellar assembly factor FliW
MLTLHTSRFGKMEIEPKRVIHFPQGLPGFPERKDYVILEHKPGSPFCWLQSLEQSDLAFVLINPFLIKADYLQDLSREEKKAFEVESGGDLVVFALVTIPPGAVEKMTANLLGPLVIDVKNKIGSQIILANSGYNHRHPLAAA